jgi:glycine cleavage system protein P-like pyridoxal-binding family
MVSVSDIINKADELMAENAPLMLKNPNDLGLFKDHISLLKYINVLHKKLKQEG